MVAKYSTVQYIHIEPGHVSAWMKHIVTLGRDILMDLLVSRVRMIETQEGFDVILRPRGDPHGCETEIHKLGRGAFNGILSFRRLTLGWDQEVSISITASWLCFFFIHVSFELVMKCRLALSPERPARRASRQASC